MIDITRTGKCYICGEPLDHLTEQEHEATMAEARENFPDQDVDRMLDENELDAVCGPCYRKFMDDFKANPERYRDATPERYRK